MSSRMRRSWSVRLVKRRAHLLTAQPLQHPLSGGGIEQAAPGRRFAHWCQAVDLFERYPVRRPRSIGTAVVGRR
jgi:hypothetical protein